MNKFQGSSNWNSNIFIDENAFENVVWKMAVILYGPQNVNWSPNRDLFYYHGLTLIPAWISNHMPGKVWDEIIHPFQASTVAHWSLGMDK